MDLMEILMGREHTPEEREEIDRRKAEREKELEKQYAEDLEWSKWFFAARFDPDDFGRVLTVWRFPNEGLRNEFVEIVGSAQINETGDRDGNCGYFPQCGIFPIGRNYVRNKLAALGVWRDDRHSIAAGVLTKRFYNYDGFYIGPELPGQVPPICEINSFGIA